MNVLGVLLFAAAVLAANARHKKEWQSANMKKVSRELPSPFYSTEICSRGVGFYRDPNDCQQYIRCVDDFSTRRRLSVFVGRCRPGLVFDENISSCNWPELAAPCSNSPERFKETTSKSRPKDQNTQQVVQDNKISGHPNRWNKPYPSQQQIIQIPHDSNGQFVPEKQGLHEPDKNVFQETETQGKIQETFEDTQTQIVEKQGQQQVPQSSDKYPKDKVQVAQTQQIIQQQAQQPISQTQQVQEQVRHQETKPISQTQQIQEQVRQQQKPISQTQQVQEQVVQQQTKPTSQTQQIREPVIQQQNEQFPHEPSVWEETIEQEKVNQESIQVQQPAITENNRQQETLQEQNQNDDFESSQLQEQVPANIFQEIPDGEVSQVVTSPNNKHIQQQKQQQAQSEWWVPDREDSQRPALSGLYENRRNTVQELPTTLEEPILCKREGFFRHPKDCRRFVKCEKTPQGTFSVKFYQCAKQLVFDERVNHCNLGHSDKCSLGRSKRQADDAVLECTGEGFFRHPRDCRSFYRCVKQQTGLYETHMFSCPDTLVFDEEYATCNWPDKAAPCDTRRQFKKPTRTPEPPRPSFKPVQKVTSKPRNDFIEQSNPFTSARGTTRRQSSQKPKYTTQSPPKEKPLCSSPGFYRHDKDCTKFFKCVKRGNYFVRYELRCPNNFAYDDNTSRCVSQRYSNACNRGNAPFPPKQDDEESTTTTEATSTASVSGQPSTGSNSDIKCKQEGYFRNPEDCNRFYRCVDFAGEGEEFVQYDFKCPDSLVFDETNSVCNWPDQSSPCEGGGGTGKDEPNQSEDDGNSEVSSDETTTARSTTSRTTTGSGRRTTSTTTTSTTLETEESPSQPGESSSGPDESTDRPKEGTKRPGDSESEDGCSEEGFFRNPDDCNKFYRCVDFRGDGREFVRYDFACAEGLVFDEANSVCNWPSESAPCNSSSGGGDDSNQGGDGENQGGSTTSSTTESRRDSTTGRESTTTPASTTKRSTTTRRSSTSTTKSSTTTRRSSTSTTKRSTTTTRRSTSRTQRPETPSTVTDKSTTTPNTVESSTGSEKKQGNGECKEAGFFRDPDDCNKFYRCVDYNGDGEEFVKYDFSCPQKLVFDEKNSVCNWPEASEPCELGSSGNKDSSTKSGEGEISTSATTQSATESSSREVTEGSTSADSTSTAAPTTSTSDQSTSSTGNPISSTKSDGSEKEGSTSKETSKSDEDRSSGECNSAGFFRNPEDCGKFYRCVDFNGDGQEFVRYDFDCPDGLYFDEDNSVCNWPEQVPACENGTGSTGGQTSQTESSSGPTTSQTQKSTAQSTTRSNEQTTTVGSTTTRDNSECTEPGFFRYRDDCRKFYRCVDDNGQLTRYDFQCPEGLLFDDQNKKCDFPSPSLSCDSNSETTTTSPIQSTSTTTQTTTIKTTTPSSTTPSTTTKGSSTSGSSGECTEEGFFRNPDDCSKYYRCVDEGDGIFTREDFSCSEDEVFDEEMRYCNRKDLAPPCEESSTSSQTQGTTISESSTLSSTSPTETSGKSECSQSGFFRCPEDCNKFYRCVDEDGNGENYVRYNFTCPEGLIFDEKNKKCDWPSSELTCDEEASTSSGTTQSTITETTTRPTSASTTDSSSTSSSSREPITCTEEGFFRNPDDCSKYYRCLDEGDGSFTREDFSCAEDEVFDEEMRYCNRKDLAPPCDENSSQQTTSSQTQETTRSDSQTQGTTDSQTQGTTRSETSTTSSTESNSKSGCTESGFFRCPEDCNKFFRCVDENGDGENYVRYNFTCPDGLIFDEKNNRCDWPSSEFTCDSDSSTSSSTSPSTSIDASSTSTSTTDSSSSETSSSSECTEEGFFRNTKDCSKYYRCLDEGDGTLTREDFSCAEDEVFDEEMRYCNRKDLAPPCDDKSQSTTESSSRTTSPPSASTTDAGGPTESSTPSSSTNDGSESTESTTKSGEESSKSGDCQEEGFHRDPQDCNKFFRCVDFNGDGQSYTRYDFVCPEGLVFDETNDVCNWPNEVPNCESSGGNGSSTSDDSGTASTTKQGDSSTSVTTSPMPTTNSRSSTTTSESTTTDSTSTTRDIESTDSSSTSSSGTTSSSDGTTSQTSSGGSSGDIECTEEGFFRHPDDCTKFYRCVDFAGTGESFVRYDFECPDDLVFDEVNKVCNWPNMSPACENGSKNDSRDTTPSENGSTTDESTTDGSTSTTSDSSTTSGSRTTSGPSATTGTTEESTTSSSTNEVSTTDSGAGGSDFQCKEEGFFRDSKNCRKYYECKRDEDSGELVKIDCECPEGQIFDTDGWYCNAEELAPPCDNGSFKCRDEGFFRDPEDCTRYYQCNRTGEGENDFTNQRFQCPDGNVFDESGRYCNAPELSEPCENSSNSSNTTPSSSTSDPNQTTTTGSSSTSDPNRTTSGSSTSNPNEPSDQRDRCTEEGFFRSSEDCTKYYQCIRNEDSGDFEIRDFACPDGRIFDEGPSYCNDPELSEEPCENNSTTGEPTGSTDSSTSSQETGVTDASSTTQQTDSTTGSSSTSSTDGSGNGNRRGGGDPDCTQEGFFRHPNDCNKFYRCVDFSGSGESYVRYDFDCPEGLHFDEVNSVCNWPTMTPRCTSDDE